MIIRPPKFSELVELVEIARALVEESPVYKNIPFEPEVIFWHMRNSLEKFHDDEGLFIMVAEDSDGKIAGAMMGGLAPYLFSSAVKYACEFSLYVKKEKRGTSAAYDLVQRFERWAEDNGAVELSMGVSTAITPERAHGFYTKMGYNHVGGVYKKQLLKGGS